MWGDAILVVLEPLNLFYLFFGALVGTIIGALPGLGPVFALALLLPLTWGMGAATALIFLSSIYASTCFGGAISAILLNAPGTIGNVATAFDGYPMAKQGQAGRALGAAILGSTVGGVLGVLTLVLVATPLTRAGLLFGPAEYFLMVVLGLSLVAVAAQGDTLRGLILAGFGMMLSMIGRSPITGRLRFVFDIDYLKDGVTLAVLAIGLFAVSQMLVLAEQGGSISEEAPDVSYKGIFSGMWEVFRQPVNSIRSAIVGTVLGIAPGIGIATANVVAYLLERNASKHPETFGKGNISGVIASEVSNNACVIGQQIPMLTLGIPGGAGAAILLAAFFLHGISVGPRFIQDNGVLAHVIFAGMFMSQIAFVVWALLGAKWFAHITSVPIAYLVPAVTAIAFLGAYALNRNPVDILVVIIFAFIGYVAYRFRYPISTLVIGFVLGPMAESNFYRAMIISDGKYGIFIASPTAKILIGLLVLALAWPYLREAVVSGFQRLRKQPPSAA